MNEGLLREIITRLLSSPELQSLLNASSPGQCANPGCLIVVNNQVVIAELGALEKRYGQDYSLGVCLVGAVELTDNKIPRVSYEQAMRETHWARIHVPVCSADQLAQIALGLSTDLTSKIVAWAITAGIPVEIGRLDLGFIAKTPEKYRRLFEGYVTKVADFGVVIADPPLPAQRPVLVPEQMGETRSLPPVERQLLSEVRYDKKLLSDKEALQLSANGVVRIAKSTVLTPAAIDVFKKQKTEVYREGVRCF